MQGLRLPESELASAKELIKFEAELRHTQDLGVAKGDNNLSRNDDKVFINALQISTIF
jgi:hypothetical protein